MLSLIFIFWSLTLLILVVLCYLVHHLLHFHWFTFILVLCIKYIIIYLNLIFRKWRWRHYLWCACQYLFLLCSRTWHYRIRSQNDFGFTHLTCVGSHVHLVCLFSELRVEVVRLYIQTKSLGDRLLQISSWYFLWFMRIFYLIKGRCLNSCIQTIWLEWITSEIW